MKCANCGLEIQGHKGDYWHTDNQNMRCQIEGHPLARPTTERNTLASIYAVLNVFTYKLEGPFADIDEALRFIGKQEDPCGLTPLPMGTQGNVREDLDPAREIVRSVGPNDKVLAIKKYRSQTGTGLKEAKDAIDAAWDKEKLGL